MTLSRRGRPGFRATATLALAAFLGSACPWLPLVGPAAADEIQDLYRARDHVEFAEFDRALGILEDLIAGEGLQGEFLREAWVLTARSHAGLNHASMATDAFCEVLRLDPDWVPDEVIFTQDEIELFGKAKADCRLEPAPTPAAGAGTPFFKKPVAWLAGGALVLVAILAGGGGGGGGGDDPLPDYPDPPTE